MQNLLTGREAPPIMAAIFFECFEHDGKPHS
jgi:hypothetical protein